MLANPSLLYASMIPAVKNKSKMHAGVPLLPTIPSRLSVGYIVAHVACFLLTTLLIQTAIGSSSFQNGVDAMAFYGVYHRTPWNQLIHFIGVPVIVGTIFILQAHLPLTTFYRLPDGPGIPSHYPSWATVLALYYVAFYVRIDTIGALLYLPLLYVLYAVAVQLTIADQHRAMQQQQEQQQQQQQQQDTIKKRQMIPSWTGTGQLIQWAVFFHMASWYVQIHPGHAIFEGAKPAVMQSIGGALSTASLFAFYEGIWFVGLRHDFQQQVLDRVDQYTAELCQQGSTMRVCADYMS